jgi:hypothetical protein
MTQLTKKIADAHINAKLNNCFDDIEVSNMGEVLLHLMQGKTFSKLMNYVESKNVSIGSALLSSALQYNSENYTKSIYKGFENLLNTIK